MRKLIPREQRSWAKLLRLEFNKETYPNSADGSRSIVSKAKHVKPKL
jgi:hypothetical protein